MIPTNILEVIAKRKPAEELLANLASDNPAVSLAAGQELVTSAKRAGLPVGDYLRLAVNPRAGQFAEAGLNGYEAALAYLGLPVRDDYDQGIVLQAAAETFQYRPGTRALFPEVVDDVVQWKYRQTQLESIDDFIAQSRNINGVQMITNIIDDEAGDYQQTGIIAEGARIPLRSIKDAKKSVDFHKYGGGYEFTYEFERRVSLDVVTPYANRVNREAGMGQTTTAISLLINGDGTPGNAAAPVVNASAIAAEISGNSAVAAGRLNWEILLRWLVNRAKAGVPIDTVAGNWDLYFEWQRMFALPSVPNGKSQMEILADAGVQTARENPRLPLKLGFALAGKAPAGKLVGFIKNETLEELVENGSEIEESVRSIENQKVRYVRTKNQGYRLIFGDTREVLNLDQVAADA
jgi:hypothetical protein